MRLAIQFLLTIMTLIFAAFTYANPANIPLTNQSIQQTNDQEFYTLHLQYPQISSPNVTNQKKFNQLMKETIDDSIILFKKELKQAVPSQKKQTQPTAAINSLIDDYKIFHHTYPVISVRFIFQKAIGMMQAHPVRSIQSINYNVRQGKILALSDFVRMNSDLLHRLSVESEKALLKNLKKEVLFADGYAEDWKNFTYWNIKKDALIITFYPGQVTAAFAGPQEITIPFEALGRKFNLS